MASWGDRTSRDPGHDRPGSAAPAAALSATSASTLASGDLPHARGAQPERALSVRPADKVELFGLVRKLLVKAALQRHDRAAELAEQAVELAASVVRNAGCVTRLASPSVSLSTAALAWPWPSCA